MVVRHSLDARSCWVYSCGVDQLMRSADALGVEKAARKDAGPEGVGAEGAFVPFVAEFVVVAVK